MLYLQGINTTTPRYSKLCFLQTEVIYRVALVRLLCYCAIVFFFVLKIYFPFSLWQENAELVVTKRKVLGVVHLFIIGLFPPPPSTPNCSQEILSALCVVFPPSIVTSAEFRSWTKDLHLTLLQICKPFSL